jgi:CubicO group peptidase (beta-lactamase class C family)
MPYPKLLLFLTVIISNVHMLHAQSADDSVYLKMDEYLNAANSISKFNGSALIAQHGKIILEKGYGYKNADTKVVNDSNGIFQIGSITKQFTATVILKLQEEGKLSVHDKLDKYFPQFLYGNDITIEHLLTHTSGIYNYTNDIDDNDSAIVSNPVSKYRVLDLIFNKPLDFPPGTEFRYSNSGYYLLGLIIEKVTGQPYETMIRNLIFTPLQMQHTGFDFSHLTDTNKTTGYSKLDANERIVAQHWDSTVTYSAGAIYSTCSDLYKWANAVAKREILSLPSWQQAFTPHLQHYGYGYFIDSSFGRRCIRHSGGLPGFISYFTYYPSEDLTIILLNNKGYYGEGLSGISTGLAAIMFHEPYQLLTAHKEIAIPTDLLKKYTGVYAFDKKHKAYVTLEDNHLQIAAPAGGLPKSPLYAESDTFFYLKVVDGIIEFVKDDNGKVTQLISHANGKDEVCRKIK